MKPNLWLLVNPNIACPIQYRETKADVKPVCEPAEETPLLETPCPLTAELSSHDAPLQEELLQMASSEYMVHTNWPKATLLYPPVSVGCSNFEVILVSAERLVLQSVNDAPTPPALLWH